MGSLGHTPKTRSRWAEGAVIYQIYPRSFQDSNSDGVGDIPGIISRLDYLKKLGITGIWLSPFYPSPMADFGYDIADYCNVDPLFGSLKDFKQLLKKAHDLDIKVIVDVVPNHTSDDHKWFKASKTSQDNEYSDWYVWKEPGGYHNSKPQPPNNWLNIFSGTSAWEWVPARKQFYLHSFDVHQPDLNWQNPDVREALKEVLRFWLRLGVDGFRVDAVMFMAKDPEFRDDPPDPEFNPSRDSVYYRLKHLNSYNWPKIYEYLNEFSEVLNEQEFSTRSLFMVTEAYVTRDDVVGNYLQYYRAMDSNIAAPFIFEGTERPLSAVDWRAFLRDFHDSLEGFDPKAVASYAFGNHDQTRIATRFGAEKARAVAVMQLTLPGMIFVYNGEELGMHNVHVPKNKIRDPQSASGKSRDVVRTPMQWSAANNAGFTDAKQPWLPLARDFKQHNTETESKDPLSFLNLYLSLIELRRSTAAISSGRLHVIEQDDHELLVFVREHGEKRYTTAVNFGDKPIDYVFDKPGHIVLSSISGKQSHTTKIDSLRLKPYEAVIIDNSTDS